MRDLGESTFATRRHISRKRDLSKLSGQAFGLAEITLGAPPGIELSAHHVGDGETMLKHVYAMGLEGIVAKRRDAPYRSGYVDSWLKIKCTQTESFAVIGYEAVRGGIRSLRVAHLVEGELRSAGSVGLKGWHT